MLHTSCCNVRNCKQTAAGNARWLAGNAHIAALLARLHPPVSHCQSKGEGSKASISCMDGLRQGPVAMACAHEIGHKSNGEEDHKLHSSSSSSRQGGNACSWGGGYTGQDDWGALRNVVRADLISQNARKG